MSQAFRLEIGIAGKSDNYFVALTDDSHQLLQIDCELKTDGKRVSYLTCGIADPGWILFGKLPDPAFANVPVKLYMAKPGSEQSITHLVFEGKVTSFQAGYPGPETLTMVAHDLSIDARRQAKYRTYRNVSSVQLCRLIAKDYGYDVDASLLGDVSIVQRAIDMGVQPTEGSALSDWDHMRRSLASDGLQLYVKGSKIIIQQSQDTNYPAKFIRGEPPVITLSVNVNHIRGPGKGGDNTLIPFQGPGDVQALKGNQLLLGAKEQSKQRTHRRPVGGANVSTTGAHSEDTTGTQWKNLVTSLKRRKDTAQLTCFPIPDFDPRYRPVLEGWGAKVDGIWFTESVKHVLLPGGAGSTTMISIMRGPSPGSTKIANLPSFST